MKRLAWLAAIGIVVLAIVRFTQSRPQSYARFPPSARGPWVAFGDSLTEGFGATEGHDYPTLLGKKLAVKILNHGVSGETSQDALARLDQSAALKPQVVLLCLGGNDTLRQVPRETTSANLATIIDRFHQAGSFVVLIGIRSAGLLDKNAAMFEKLAAAKRVLLVPNMLDGVLLDPKLMSDPLHPNDAGYEYIATRLEAVLQPLLPRLQPR